MRARAVRADVVSYSTAISACEKAARWERALALLAAMRADALRADVIAYSMTISACEKAAQWQRALALLDELRARRLAPDAIAYNAAISACGRALECDRALALLDTMLTARGGGARPTDVSFNAAAQRGDHGVRARGAVGAHARAARKRVY